jgi:predicted Zn-dependent peptidase
MEDPDLASLLVFNAVFGGGSTSKLFMNVREKLQLCYYAGSLVDTHKGLLLVSSGVEFSDRDAAQAEIFAQLDAMRRGEITDEELNAARSGVASDLRSLEDSQGELEGFYLAAALDGPECSPPELAELCENVSREDVMAVANSLECDLIYFLRGEDEEGAPASEEEDDAEN